MPSGKNKQKTSMYFSLFFCLISKPESKQQTFLLWFVLLPFPSPSVLPISDANGKNQLTQAEGAGNNPGKIRSFKQRLCDVLEL